MTRKIAKKRTSLTRRSSKFPIVKSLADIERLALHALDSGPSTPLTSEDFEEIRRKLRKKYGHRNGRAK